MEDVEDVDEEAAPSKRTKANSGAAIAKTGRAPRSNRQFAGMRDEAVSGSVVDTLRLADGVVCVIASCQGCQAAEPGAKRAEHARKGRRVRPCDQGQDGAYSCRCVSRCQMLTETLSSPSTCSLASGRWARPTAGSLLHVLSVSFSSFALFIRRFRAFHLLLLFPHPREQLNGESLFSFYLVRMCPSSDPYPRPSHRASHW